MGPGTRIMTRILSHIRPTTHVDKVALEHDLDYITDKEPILSDLKAILKTFNPDSFLEFAQAISMRSGLLLRSVIDGLFHLTPFSNPTHINSAYSNYNQLLAQSQSLQPYT